MRRIDPQVYAGVKALQQEGFSVEKARKTAKLSWDTVRNIYESVDLEDYRGGEPAQHREPPYSSTPKSSTMVALLKDKQQRMNEHFNYVIAELNKESK